MTEGPARPGRARTSAGTRNIDGVCWIELGQAARLSRTKMAAILAAVEQGIIRALDIDGRVHIPLSSANRLKREAITMQSIKRRTRIGDMIPLNGRGTDIFTRTWDPSPGERPDLSSLPQSAEKEEEVGD